jgi:V8-like Glu-specific endopeptidase
MTRQGRALGATCIRSAPILAVLAAFLLCGSGTAAAAGVQPSSTAVQAALRYWTPARMRSAEPMEVKLPRYPHLGVGARPRGAPGAVASSAPAASAPGAVSFEAVPDPAAEGFRRNGVIFFLAGGEPARCSGTSVNAPNLSVVFTAGHCVLDESRRRWFDRLWVFVPGFRFGQRPFGVFPATDLDTTDPWISSRSEDADVGAAVVGPNERGELLGEAVGGDGIAWNQPAKQVFDVHGYPAGPPFDGETQRLCAQTPFLGHDLLSYLMDGPLNLAVSCNVTGGASGGAWTIAGDKLNSVTDYAYPLDPATDYGSYFCEEVARLYGRVARIR